MNARPDWHKYFSWIAEAVASRADCSRRKVGAVIVDQDHRIISTGYNGSAAGAPGCLTDGACPRARAFGVKPGAGYEESACVAIHAEHNAVLYARRDLRGCAIYITDAPCQQCTVLLGAVGITDIYVGRPA